MVPVFLATLHILDADLRLRRFASKIVGSHHPGALSNNYKLIRRHTRDLLLTPARPPDFQVRGFGASKSVMQPAIIDG
jgi:hypothetical protein